MLFKNKIEYTKGMFVEIYGTEIKKVRLVLRIITGIAVVAAIAFMIYGAAARGILSCRETSSNLGKSPF